MKRSFVVAVMLVAVLGGVATADRSVVRISSNELSTHAAADTTLGGYYVLEFDIPEGVSSSDLAGAMLEFYMDVSARDLDDVTNDSPMLEIYVLRGALQSGLDLAKIRTPSSMHRNINIGSDKLVRIDVTEAVVHYLNNPSQNHGLVVGSLTNSRDGLFTMNSNGFGAGIPARVVIHH